MLSRTAFIELYEKNKIIHTPFPCKFNKWLRPHKDYNVSVFVTFLITAVLLLI